MASPFLSAFVDWAWAARLDHRAALQQLAAVLAEQAGVGGAASVAGGLDLTPPASPPPASAPPWPVPDRGAGPALLGQAHEALLDAGHRRAKGVHYTPDHVADGVVAAAIGGAGDGGVAMPRTVADPAVGGGAFLLAAARRLEASGLARATIVEERLWGVDVDPLAVEVATTALALWAAAGDRLPRWSHLAVADTLRTGRAVWPDAPADGFDLVVGNPPFQNQLGMATARALDERDELRERFGVAAFRYADTAGLFLLEACRWAAPGGRVSMIVPQSFLVADDAASLRRSILELGTLDGMWLATEPVFAANVRVCAPVIVVGGRDTGAVRRWRGRDFATAPPHVTTRRRLRDAPTWAPVASDLLGVPSVALGDGETLASFCTATAGFRDQFYGLAPFVREADDASSRGGGPSGGRAVAPLLTSGLIDPVHSHWGRRPTRFAGERFAAPVVDLDALAAGDEALMRWTRARLVPKVVVATQTRVLEAVVDEDGTTFPSVPTIALTSDPARLWEAAAVVLAPAISAWAMARHAGAALSTDALKVSARQLLRAPLPHDREAWLDACEPLRLAAKATDEHEARRHLEAFGSRMGAAYGTDEAVLAWWMGRVPAWRRR